MAPSVVLPVCAVVVASEVTASVVAPVVASTDSVVAFVVTTLVACSVVTSTKNVCLFTFQLHFLFHRKFFTNTTKRTSY